MGISAAAGEDFAPEAPELGGRRSSARCGRLSERLLELCDEIQLTYATINARAADALHRRSPVVRRLGRRGALALCEQLAETGADRCGRGIG